MAAAVEVVVVDRHFDKVNDSLETNNRFDSVDLVAVVEYSNVGAVVVVDEDVDPVDWVPLKDLHFDENEHPLDLFEVNLHGLDVIEVVDVDEQLAFDVAGQSWFDFEHEELGHLFVAVDDESYDVADDDVRLVFD